MSTSFSNLHSDHHQIGTNTGGDINSDVELNKTIQAAFHYLAVGFSVIPLKPRGKKPLIPWQEYQTRQPTEDEIREWFTKTDNNIGIVCGRISGITVVDFDTAEAIEFARGKGFPSVPQVQTAKGFHAYCQYESGHRNFQKRANLPGIDLRAEGGYVVAPPSTHETGYTYKWSVPLGGVELPTVPDWVLVAKPEDKQPLSELYTGCDAGERNNGLARLVGSWLNDGGTLEEILTQARIWNATNNPPLPEKELIATVHSINKRHESYSQTPTVITDSRVAEHFAAKYSQVVRYWAESRKWLIFDGQRWNTDTPGGAYPCLKQMVAGFYENARNIVDENFRQDTLKGIIKLESHRRQETLLDAAAVVPEMIVNSYQLDSDPMLLNVRNGTLDLKTGELMPHSPDDFLTRLVNIDYNEHASCPEFHRFLDRILGGKQELIDYLQRFIGYCLTGMTIEQVLLFLYGTGANGKSTLATIIEKLLCDLASVADSSLLMQRDNRTASNDLAALRGSRLVKVSEFNDGERLAEATIKTLTGGDRVTCRFLYGEFFEYTPQFKVLLLGNYKPKVRGQDLGIW
ncbi:MAG: bifunctional DNA primase/polymerase, partial [Anaerolineaceae bacterium]|nr:bifunctional DNA primase/polymerase [Anaerolineaceae bacterium]